MDLFKLIAEYIGNGYIVHGTNLDIDKFDSSFIKGGFRAGEGYGFYFTSRPSKALDYGTKFYAVKADEFNFVSTNANPTEVFKDVINAEEGIQWLRNKQSEVRNNRDYDMYEVEINKTNNFYKSIVCDSITEHIIDIVKWKKPSSMRELWYSHVSSDYIPFIANMLLKLGYDGYREDDIYTIFNVKKLNEKFIKINTSESMNENIILESLVSHLVRNYLLEDNNRPNAYQVWLNKFDKFAKLTIEELQNDYLNPLGLKLNVEYSEDTNTQNLAVCKPIYDTNLKIVVFTKKMYIQMKQRRIDKDAFNIEAQARITLGHEVGHGIVDYLIDYYVGKDKTISEFRRDVFNGNIDEEELVEEFGESMFPEATGVWSSELSYIISKIQ